jgi:hypothetical protein
MSEATSGIFALLSAIDVKSTPARSRRRAPIEQVGAAVTRRRTTVDGIAAAVARRPALLDQIGGAIARRRSATGQVSAAVAAQRLRVKLRATRKDQCCHDQRT